MSKTKTIRRRRRGPLPDYYRVLGIPHSASMREIEDAYWEEAFRAHSKARRRSAQTRLSRLNEAYEVLGSPDIRAAYDAKRRKTAKAKEERSWVRTLLRLHDPAGQALAEYSLILTAIAVGVVVPTMLLFRETLSGAFTSALNCLGGSC